MSRIQDDDVDYLKIPLECPKCGLHGWTLVTRADRRFRCKRCKAKFYIDRRGHITSEKPAASQDITPRRSIDPLGVLAAIWSHRSRPVKLALGTSAILLLGAVSAWLFRPGPELPQSLPARAAFVADAFARNESELVRAVALPDTSHMIDSWLKNRRPAAWGEELASDKFVDVDVHVLAQSFAQGTAWVRARVKVGPAAEKREMTSLEEDHERPASNLASTKPEDKSKELNGSEAEILLFWKMSKSGHWLLDCATTMKHQRRG